jgi:hypothetical protein
VLLTLRSVVPLHQAQHTMAQHRTQAIRTDKDQSCIALYAVLKADYKGSATTQAAQSQDLTGWEAVVWCCYCCASRLLSTKHGPAVHSMV